MNIINDRLISAVTVRLSMPKSQVIVGSAVLYAHTSLKDVVYVLTAAHNLYADGENLTDVLESIMVEFYNPLTMRYISVIKEIDERLVSRDINRDFGILVFSRAEIEEIIGAIPEINVVESRMSFDNFSVKGFPNATKGEELAAISPIWKQEMTEVHKFQMELKEDYSDWATEGFSGSGVFVNAQDDIFLLGIFTRYRAAERGKVIYCQYVSDINALLEKSYFRPIRLSYISSFGLHPAFFREKVEEAIEDLGPRFNKALNFRLPIAVKFNDMEKGSSWKHRVLNIFDKWLTEDSYRTHNGNEHIGDIEIKLTELRFQVRDWLDAQDWGPNFDFNVEWIYDAFKNFDDIVTTRMDILHAKGRQEEEGKVINRNDYAYRSPYSKENDRLREIRNLCSDLLGNLEQDLDIPLTNHPFLIIKGEAGAGKSHLLGDIANRNTRLGKPVVLLLGQHFKGTRTIEANILERLDLQCKFNEFITDLNQIGLQLNQRIPILIDAINETRDPEIWQDQLAGFITKLRKFPFVYLVFTVRTSYFKIILPPQVLGNQDIRFLDHEGFRGNEYEALKLFCEHYGLRQPTFPILAPEFSNPLFLQMVCLGVKNSPNRKFPTGFHGIKEVFQLYIDALNGKLLQKPRYSNRPKLVTQAILEVAAACFESDIRMLPLEQATELFDNKFGNFPELMEDLIRENVLIKNQHYNNGNYEDCIYFAYERFGDFFIAERILSTYSEIADIVQAFQPGETLATLTVDEYNEGLVEALSVLLPESYGLELFELMDWVYQRGERNRDYFVESLLSRHFLRSLTWRSFKSLDIIKIDNWLQSGKFKGDIDDWFLKLVEFSAIPSHPLNSDRLFTTLKGFSMPMRDSFWQMHLLYYSGYDDYRTAYPIRRLIDWAWTPNISSNLDTETARLAAQSLAWVLATTQIPLRDQVTKALVNLLQHQPQALLAVLKKFRRCNDPYICERLFAVAYGCVLRTDANDAAQTVARYIYESYFKKGNPPVHVMSRDYLRNICEWAKYLNPTVRFDMKLVRPPYKSAKPLFPEENDIEKFHIEYNKLANIPYAREFNQIRRSVMDGDFGNKIIDSALHSLAPISNDFKRELLDFKSKLSRDKKKLVSVLAQQVELQFLYKSRRDWLKRNFDNDEQFDAHVEELSELIERLLTLFDDSQQQWLRTTAMPAFFQQAQKKNKEPMLFQTRPVKRWIVKRVFELGYNKKLHGDYDSRLSGYNSRHDNKVERIGKKYQWIAYHEVVARLTDHYSLTERWNGRPAHNFDGTWQMYLRDIDPAYIMRNREDDDQTENSATFFDEIPWWNDPSYSHWNVPSDIWYKETDDLPETGEILIKKDTSGTDWVHLEHYVEWKEPKKLGQDRYLTPNKRIMYMVQAYLVKKTDRRQIMEYLSSRTLFGRWMPENRDLYHHQFNREKFWSPAYFGEGKEAKWETIRDTNHKVIVATTSAKGSFENDKSGANRPYSIPCQTLFDGMKLQYAPRDGDFIGSDGELVVTNVHPKGVLVRKEALERYLSQSNLEIIWTILSEKIDDLGGNDYRMSVPCGIYTLREGVLKGRMLLFSRED